MARFVKLRYWFWSKVHAALESAWHWVYYRKLKPVTPPFPQVGNVLYQKILENDEVTIYRSSGQWRS